jgi:dynactin-6
VNIAAPDREGCKIENYVMVEMNAMVEARSVGEGTFIEVGAKLGGKCVVGKVGSTSVGGLCELGRGFGDCEMA